jgi:hypothetical protein
VIYALFDEIAGYRVCPVGQGNVTAQILGNKTAVFVSKKIYNKI